MMFWDERGLHFDLEKFWDNDISTVLQRWKDKVGDEEVDKTIARATSFNLAEQCVIKEIVAEGGPEHFPADAESLFSHGGLS
jgi:hypothetical protein